MSIRSQIRPVLTLALPLILAELGWMSMGIVDTIMVGHTANPALAISAVALGQVLYNTIAFGIAGVLLGLDTYLAQSHGAGRFDEATAGSSTDLSSPPALQPPSSSSSSARPSSCSVSPSTMMCSPRPSPSSAR